MLSSKNATPISTDSPNSPDAMRLSYAPCNLQFRQPATTSRETMNTKLTCFLKVYDEHNPEVYGLGEAALFPGLSPEANEEYELKLIELHANIALGRPTDLSRHSSIQYGLEMALRDFAGGGKRLYWPSEFTEGKESLTINGLVWMGDIDTMRRRAQEKIDAGFHCVKFKIGALNWDAELGLITEIRKANNDLEIRVDANGGLPYDRAEKMLGQLADLGVESIEQPFPARYYRETGRLCRTSPVPIALDEDLIGIYDPEERRAMLKHVHPQLIVLKPALCGGFNGAEDWIEAAELEGIRWWVTSALESNVGLNALAQWTASLGEKTKSRAQGLGTGALFVENTPSPLILEGEKLTCSPVIDNSSCPLLDKLEWRS